MKWMLVTLLVIHGAVHLMGPAKAFGIAALPELGPITRSAGLAWLGAAIAMFATAALLVSSPRLWWMGGVAAVLASQAVIFGHWSDAKLGTIGNLVLLGAIVYGFASQGPPSFRRAYDQAVSERLLKPAHPAPLTEADLESLPGPVRRYIRQSGAVGRPRPHDFQVRMMGRIRASPEDPWMEFTAEQNNFVDDPARFFLMDARRRGLPVDVYHSFENGRASLGVRLISIFPVAGASGPELDQSETVTLFNDVCLFAPAALIDDRITWESIDAHSARGRFAIGTNVVSATLHFNEAGELVDFVSDDRLAAAADYESFARQRWSTPIGDYRDYGPLRLMSRGEGRWHAPTGEFVYLEARVIDVKTNVGMEPRRRRN
jgi:hypothetical protein